MTPEEAAAKAVEECAKLVAEWGYHPPPPGEAGTEPPEGVTCWGNSVDNRFGNEAAIAQALRDNRTSIIARAVGLTD